MSTLRCGCSKAIPKVAIPFRINYLKGTGSKPSLWQNGFIKLKPARSCPKLATMIYEVRNATDLAMLMASFKIGLTKPLSGVRSVHLLSPEGFQFKNKEGEHVERQVDLEETLDHRDALHNLELGA